MIHINVLAMLDHRVEQHNIIKVCYRFIGIILDKITNFMRYSYVISLLLIKNILKNYLQIF